MLLKRLPSFFILLALAMSARADVIYTFTFTATSGPFQSTTFQLDEPSFLVAGTYFPTPPIIFSDSSALYPFNVLSINPFGSDLCFVFEVNANSVGGCGANLSASTVQVGEVSFEFPGSTPPSTLETLVEAALRLESRTLIAM
jgi:hypothetical protein